VWRPVFWGFLLQFIMGLLVLRWDWGSHQFNLFSESVLAFLEFSRNGTDFVYGFLSVPPNICGMNPVFAFQSAQVVVYFGAVVVCFVGNATFSVLISRPVAPLPLRHYAICDQKNGLVRFIKQYILYRYEFVYLTL
jgi:nucleoside permease NupC